MLLSLPVDRAPERSIDIDGVEQSWYNNGFNLILKLF